MSGSEYVHYSLRLLFLAWFTELAVDAGYFIDPALSLRVLKIQDVIQRPVKVIGDVGYLLVQAVKGVACYSPPRLAKSTSN